MEEIIFVKSCKGKLLDEFLEFGWYRTNCYMFTTNYINYSEQLYRVHWLRYRIPDLVFGKPQKAVLKKAANFEIIVEPIALDTELEQLFSTYRSNAQFVGYTSLSEAFCMGLPVFDSKIVKVRFNGQLIAAGFLDVGEVSVAGIMNIFNHEFAKYSPGKLLVLQKINYCIANKIQYYYPGYLVPGISKFDYKLFPDKNATEVWVPEIEKWLPFTLWEELGMHTPVISTPDQ
jgi:leucyl-tRNA---protein transferase